MLFSDKCKALIILSIFLFGNVFCSDCCKKEQKDFVRNRGKVEDYLGDINSLFIKMACACSIRVEEVESKEECAFEFKVENPDNTDSVFDISVIDKTLLVREIQPLSNIYQEIQEEKGLRFIEEMRPSSCWDSININRDIFYFLKPKSSPDNQALPIVSIFLKVMRDVKQLYGQFDRDLKVEKIGLSMLFYIKAASMSMPEKSCLEGIDSPNGRKSVIKAEVFNIAEEAILKNIEIVQVEPLSLSRS